MNAAKWLSAPLSRRARDEFCKFAQILSCSGEVEFIFGSILTKEPLRS